MIMVDERLYRLRSKDGSHFNEKTNEEGWNSAVQFDEENNLQGPLEYQVVDESEYTQVVEVERKQRTCYEKYYSKKIDNEYVLKTFNAMYLFNIATRSILYAIVYTCSENRSEQIDVQRVHQMSGLDLYNFAGVLQFLEEQKFIKEEKYVNEDDGYEDENGDFHLVKRNYLFKTVNGTWYLKKKSRLLLLIVSYLRDYNRFYNFIVNRQMHLLFDNEQ